MWATAHSFEYISHRRVPEPKTEGCVHGLIGASNIFGITRLLRLEEVSSRPPNKFAKAFSAPHYAKVGIIGRDVVFNIHVTPD